MPIAIQPKTLSLFLQLGVRLTSTPQVELPFVRVQQRIDHDPTSRCRSPSVSTTTTTTTSTRRAAATFPCSPRFYLIPSHRQVFYPSSLPILHCLHRSQTICSVLSTIQAARLFRVIDCLGANALLRRISSTINNWASSYACALIAARSTRGPHYQAYERRCESLESHTPSSKGRLWPPTPSWRLLSRIRKAARSHETFKRTWLPTRTGKAPPTLIVLFLHLPLLPPSRPTRSRASGESLSLASWNQSRPNPATTGRSVIHSLRYLVLRDLRRNITLGEKLRLPRVVARMLGRRISNPSLSPVKALRIVAIGSL